MASEKLAQITEGISEFGFMVNSEDRVRVDGFIATKVHTLGLWTCDMPEFVTYGPFDGLDSSVVQRVVAVYLERGEHPRDGDQVIVGSRRLTLREIFMGGPLGEAFYLNLVVAMTMSPLDFLSHKAFQIVGDIPPPKAHYEGAPTSARTIASEEEYDVNVAIGRALRRREESRRLRWSNPDIAR